MNRLLLIVSLVPVILMANSRNSKQVVSVLIIGASLVGDTYKDIKNVLVKANPSHQLIIERAGQSGVWGPKEASESERDLKKMRSRKWNYIVVMGNSVRPAWKNGTSPFFQNASDVLAKIIYANHPRTTIIYYQSWGYKNDHGDRSRIPHERHAALLLKSYSTAAKRHNAIVAPVGQAVLSLRKKSKELCYRLYQDDHHVGGGLCGYMAGLVFNKIIFKTDPLAVRWYPEYIDPARRPPGEWDYDATLIYRMAAAEAFGNIKESSFPDNPMLHGVHAKYLNKELSKLSESKNIFESYKLLIRYSKGSDPKSLEARSALNAIRSWVAIKEAEAGQIESKSISDAYIYNYSFFRTIKGLAQSIPLRYKLKKQAKDSQLMTLVFMKKRYYNALDKQLFNKSLKSDLLDQISQLKAQRRALHLSNDLDNFKARLLKE